MKGQYDDIINMPHHVSPTRPQMPMQDRAAQFSPFAALTGYEAAIDETGRRTDEKADLCEEEELILNQKQAFLQTYLRECAAKYPTVSVTYFLPDERKEGGAYVTAMGELKRIDEYERLMLFADGTRIPLDNIASIESDIFPVE